MRGLEMNSNVKTIKLTTPHFEATVNVADRSFTIFGDFRTKDVYKMPPRYDWTSGNLVLQGLIDELIALEDEARKMIGNAPETKEDDVPWLMDASGS